MSKKKLNRLQLLPLEELVAKSKDVSLNEDETNIASVTLERIRTTPGFFNGYCPMKEEKDGNGFIQIEEVDPRDYPKKIVCKYFSQEDERDIPSCVDNDINTSQTCPYGNKRTVL